MYHDNISAIAMEKKLVNHSQTRHTAIKYCFIREAIVYGQSWPEVLQYRGVIGLRIYKTLPGDNFYNLDKT